VKVYVRAERAEYYAEGRVEKVTRYTPREALRENIRTGHFGPWEDEYRALCVRRDGRGHADARA
jgi:hypothetical protein